MKEIIVVSDVNENVLNIITPSGIDHDNNHINIGENVGEIFTISKYPSHVDYGWLVDLCSLEGTATVIEYRHTSPARMIKVMNKQVSELKSNASTAKEESVRQGYERGVDDLKEMIKRIGIRNEPVGYLNVMLLIQSPTHETLNQRIKRVSSSVSVAECNMRNLKYRQLEAYQAMSPFGIPDRENVSNMGERSMPISTFIGGFPMASSGLNDKNGYYLGRTKNKKIVRVNPWLRNKDRTNSNWIIFGVPGTGKSTAIKNILAMEFALGAKIIIFDPEIEYVDLARHEFINGEVLNCASGLNSRINPLQIRSAPYIKPEDLDEGEELSDYFVYDLSNGVSDMALYIQQLRFFFSLYFGKNEFTATIKTHLEKCLIELYGNFGITWDTDIKKLKNEDFPIIEDLYHLVKNKADKADEPYLKNIYRNLEDLLFSAGEGADSHLWNGHTTLDPKTDFTDLVVSGLLDADDNVRNAQFYNITTWAWGQMSEDRTQKVIFVVDEGYLFVDPENPDLMKFFRNISKRDRKYEGGLMFITHSCVDIMDKSVKRYGQALMDNACYKFLMGSDGKNLKDTTELFNLSEKEVAILAAKNRGQGILMAGSTRINLTVEVSDEFLKMFGKAGGR
jgi:type IV secretory pathway VirB4 component